MKIRRFKIVGIILGCIAGLMLVGFAIYMFRYYPREAESFEIITANPTKNILIASQGTDFKDVLTNTLCDSLGKSSMSIRVIDVKDLVNVNDEDWDRILIINSFIIRLNKIINRFINNSSEPGKILIFVTSGGADWQPQSQLKVDAITSASREMYMKDLVHLITDWMDNEEYQEWHPDDYLLALNYFPQVDVGVACNEIALEQEKYLSLYPNLVDLINRTGYYYLRLKDVPSALKIFKLNINLFPDNWNVYDSYGEALLENGDRESAIRNYRKALKLNPNSKSSNDMLKKLNKE